jgi:AcrR family transcriptional regulator
MLINEKQPKLDPRVKRTRQLLQKSFAELLTEKDFHNITVHDIAQRAELNRATFYLHFEDKYALLSHSVRAALAERLEKKLPDAHTLSFDNLRLLAAVVTEFMDEFFGQCQHGPRNDMQLLIGAEVQKHVFELLLNWSTNSVANTSHDPNTAEHAAVALSWIIFGTGFQSHNSRQKQSPEQWADQMLTFLVRDLPVYLDNPIRMQK